MIIYSNSCSYGIVSDGPVYSDFLAEKFKAQLINRGLSGSCNERIFRTATRDILTLIENNHTTDILVLIGLTNTFRGEYWSTTPSIPLDGHFVSFTSSKSNMTGIAKQYQKEFYKVYNHEAAITNLLTQLIMFTGFLKSLKIKYLIWANTNHLDPIDFNCDFVKSFYNAIEQDPNILPLFNFNFCEFARINGHPTMDKPYDQGGHPNSSAHRHFAEYLIAKINQVYGSVQ